MNEEVEEGIIVAQAYDYKLYMQDLQQEIPSGLHGTDSILFVQNYINRWMQEKVMLYYSNQNLAEEALDLEKKIVKYRNSLLIYNYQKRFIQQNLDTIVSDQEIEEYYQSHLSDFELKDNIVKVMFIKLEKDSRNIREASKLMKSRDPEDKEKIKDLADRYAINYFIEDDVWLLFEDLLKEVPIKTYNQENFLKNNTFVKISDSLYTTLVQINGFRIKESVSPLSFEYDRIRHIILNKRKMMLLSKLENDLLDKARNEGALQTFN
jgi:predicted DNA binding CopG/RHH family protein